MCFWVLWTFSAWIWAKLAPIYLKRHLQHDSTPHAFLSTSIVFWAIFTWAWAEIKIWRKWPTSSGFSFFLQWDVPEKIHAPPSPLTDGILEIPAGRGSKTINRGWTWESLLQGSFRPIVHMIQMFSSVTLQPSQTLKIVQMFCSRISHLTWMII